MKNLLLILLLFLFQCLNIYAIEISGKVIDQLTNHPIPYATVYVDGTTMGTMTDINGSFNLKVISLPENVMVSHVSYKSKRVAISKKELRDMIISLEKKEIEIGEIEVMDNNRRDRNLRIFKLNFLGSDRWGLNAKILNEDAIVFYTVYETIKITAPSIKSREAENLIDEMEMEKDSTSIQFKNKKGLGAMSKEPLRVLLPDLGYEIQVDLSEFIYNYGFNQGYYYSGAYYFKPIEPKNEKEKKRYEKNRIKVYYNSNMHFCRSLYQNQLAQNGYKMLKVVEAKNGSKKYEKFDFAPYLSRTDNKEVLLTGLNDEHFHIRYYKKGHMPKDLTQKKMGISIQSELYIKSDTCRIRKDGTMDGYEFMFAPEIGVKQVGAILPSDYLPSD